MKLVRDEWVEFGYVEYRKAEKEMDQHMERSKTQDYKDACAAREQLRERQGSADYMRQRHGLVESREPAYKPVGGKVRKGRVNSG